MILMDVQKLLLFGLSPNVCRLGLQKLLAGWVW